MTVKELIEMLKTCDEESIVYIDYNGDINSIKELIDKLQQFNGDRVVLVEDTEYGEFQAIDVKPEDDRFVMITTTVK